jgi:4-amino-4-deoxy-L-arabinose transferase-like glycosyltransferase
MNNRRIRSDPRKVEFRDRLSQLPAAWILVAVGLTLLWAGLSTRSLWGPEGRWAVIVKEMMSSGNFFLPTINGVVYFDKPLLSYWMMMPSANIAGISETVLRIPSTLAALGAVLIVYSIGCRLFSARIGIIAGLLLATATMFLFWGRTISVEMMNLVAIWALLLVFLLYQTGGKNRYLPLLYSLAAVSAFLKGPVAPAVVFFAIGVFSAGEAIWRDGGERGSSGTGRVRHAFSWILSGAGLASVLVGAIVFFFILFLPVLTTGSWESVLLMWKENVLRFLSPFDHQDAPHAYIQAILVFVAPWSFLFISSLCATSFRGLSWQERWLLLSSAAILSFFLISGSRRPYYILPLIPALMLISARSIDHWVEGNLTARRDSLMTWGMSLTALALAIAGFGLLYAYLFLPEYSHFSEPPTAVIVLAAVGAAMVFLVRKRRTATVMAILSVAFILNLWCMTGGFAVGERARTTREFSRRFAEMIDRTGHENTALFGDCPAEVIYYLDRSSPIRTISRWEEAEEFGRTHPGGLLLIDPESVPDPMKPLLQRLEPVLRETPASPGRDTEGLVVLQFPKE